MLKLISLLAQFDEDAVAALRMHKGNQLVVRPDLGLSVEQLKSLLFKARHLAPNVGDREGDVVDALSFAGQEFGDRAVFICGFQELDFVWAYLEKGGFHALAQYLFDFVVWLAKKRSEYLVGSPNVLDSDADVFNLVHVICVFPQN